MQYVPLSHLRSKGTASEYITYCTGSGMLMTYNVYTLLTVQYKKKNIALVTV